MNGPDKGLREVAARIAGRADLADVRLFASSARSLSVPDPDARLSWTLDLKPSVSYAPGDSHCIVDARFVITVTSSTDDNDGDGDGDEMDDAGSTTDIALMEFTFGALYTLDLDADEVPREVEMEAFAQTTGAFALYPYGRAYAQDLSTRMGLPALTLGLYKLEIADPAGTPRSGEAD